MAKLGSYIRTPETNLINDLEQENMKLKDKVEGLQDKIDSAINIIEKEEHSNWVMYGRTELLNILKGDNK